MKTTMQGVLAKSGMGYRDDRGECTDETLVLDEEQGEPLLEVPYDSGVCAVFIPVKQLVSWLKTNRPDLL